MHCYPGPAGWFWDGRSHPCSPAYSTQTWPCLSRRSVGRWRQCRASGSRPGPLPGLALKCRAADPALLQVFPMLLPGPRAPLRFIWITAKGRLTPRGLLPGCSRAGGQQTLLGGLAGRLTPQAAPRESLRGEESVRAEGQAWALFPERSESESHPGQWLPLWGSVYLSVKGLIMCIL